MPNINPRTIFVMETSETSRNSHCQILIRGIFVMEITDASTNWFNHNNGINVAELIKVLCSAIGTSDKKVIH